MHYLYLWIDLFTLLGPLVLSFDKKVQFFKNWRRLFLSILIMMIVFIPWDVAFTINEIWGFNPDFLCGLKLFHLPIEEWLFFIVVPYATIFIYECCKAYFRDVLASMVKPILFSLGLTLLVFGVLFFDRWYTVVNFIGAGTLLILAVLIKQKNLGFLLQAFLVSLIPFLVVNGLLTGSFIEEPIVWYNNEENLGFRIFTIPVEDIFYFLFFFVLVLIPYERLEGSR